MDLTDDLIYRIDAHDKIVFVNTAWDRFADANAGQAIRSKRVLDRSLWDFIEGATTRELYRLLVDRVRAGHTLTFQVRCDSPEERRSLAMTMRPEPEEAVEFRTQTLSVEHRDPQRLFDADARRSIELLRGCSWCNRFFVGTDWVEVEAAVIALQLMERSVLPSITHGICDDCIDRISDLLHQPR